MATLTNPGKYKCHQKIHDDPNLEHFILISTDPMASHVVRIWAHAYKRDWHKLAHEVCNLIACAGSMVRHSSDRDAKVKEAIECAEFLAAQNQGRRGRTGAEDG